MEYKIYSQAGILKTSFSPGTSTHTHEAMVENVLNLSFTLNEFISLEVNDYIDIDIDRFTLIEAYKPVIKNKKQYQYDVKLYGAESIAKNAQLVDDNYEPITSYYDTPAAQLQYIVNCINRVVGSNRYTVGAVVSSAAILVEYSSGSNCFQALTALANAAGTEWWMDGTSFNLTKCEHGETMTIGYGAGLLSLDKQISNDNEFFTRLIPLGSTKNIVKSTYGYKRLQLPGGAKFVDQNVSVYGVKEKIEEEAFADIYPRFTGTVGVVRTEVKTIEGTERTIYYFTDTTIDFNPNDYAVDGLVKHIVFKSGDLIAQYFEANWYPATGEWEIINQYPDESTQVPGGYVIPRTGDTYTIYNIEMPAIYRTNAEAELLVAVQTYLAKYAIDFSVYKAATDHVYLEEKKMTLTLGRRVKLISEEYFTSGSRDSRITKITRKLSDLNQMDIEVSNVILKSSYAQLKDDVSNLKTRVDEQLSTEVLNIIKSSHTGDLTDDNVLSSLRVLKEIKKRAISKTEADTAQKMITFLEGIKLGDYVSGITGRGGFFDKNGNGELQSLILHSFLQVDEFRFNRIDVVSGELWNAVAYGKIESVDTVNNIVTLQLEADDIRSVHLNDFCRGIFHFADANEINNGVDGAGFPVRAGFATSYFIPVELLSDGKSFKYELKKGTTVHPCELMNFVVYGNATEKDRQKSVYHTRSYVRMLSDVDTWDIDPDRNIAMQFGDCTGLTIGGEDMSGYSGIFRNIYITGVIKWIEDNIEKIKGQDGYSVALSSYDAVVAVDSDGNIDSSVYDIINIVSGNEAIVTGSSQVLVTIFKIQTTIQAYQGSTKLAYSDTIGTGKYIVSANTSGCEYTISDGIVTITKITQDKAILVLTINCEGITTFEKTFTLTRVYGVKGDPGEQGLQGLQGEKGEQGIPGNNGISGKTSYFHIKYSNVENPTSPEQISEESAEYIGTYVDFVEGDSTDPSKYTWKRFRGLQGVQGEQGIPGIGTDGKTYYLHIKYSDDGGITLTSNNGEDTGNYIGQYTDETKDDSSDVTKYKWSHIKGDQGIPGADGKDGLDASTLFPWLDEWNNNKTLFGSESVVSPKMFSGTKDPTTGNLTGVALGREIVNINGVKRTGVFGIKNGELTFELDSATGDLSMKGQVKATSGSVGDLDIIDGEIVGRDSNNIVRLRVSKKSISSFSELGTESTQTLLDRSSTNSEDFNLGISYSRPEDGYDTSTSSLNFQQITDTFQVTAGCNITLDLYLQLSGSTEGSPAISTGARLYSNLKRFEIVNYNTGVVVYSNYTTGQIESAIIPSAGYYFIRVSGDLTLDYITPSEQSISASGIVSCDITLVAIYSVQCTLIGADGLYSYWGPQDYIYAKRNSEGQLDIRMRGNIEIMKRDGTVLINS